MQIPLLLQSSAAFSINSYGGEQPLDMPLSLSSHRHLHCHLSLFFHPHSLHALNNSLNVTLSLHWGNPIFTPPVPCFLLTRGHQLVVWVKSNWYHCVRFPRTKLTLISMQTNPTVTIGPTRIEEPNQQP